MDYYQIYRTKDCPKGWAFVRDFKCNLVFYGTIEECYVFIDEMTGFGLGGDNNVSD